MIIWTRLHWFSFAVFLLYAHTGALKRTVHIQPSLNLVAFIVFHITSPVRLADLLLSVKVPRWTLLLTSSRSGNHTTILAFDLLLAFMNDLWGLPSSLLRGAEWPFNGRPSRRVSCTTTVYCLVAEWSGRRRPGWKQISRHRERPDDNWLREDAWQLTNQGFPRCLLSLYNFVAYILEGQRAG